MPLTGRCHCGANSFRVDGELPAKLTRCTCSFCAKRGALVAYVEPRRFSAAPADEDTVYRWNTKTVAHHFCRVCGCALYSDSPAFQPDGSWDGATRRIGLNARLIDDFEAAEWPVQIIDGKNLW